MIATLLRRDLAKFFPFTGGGSALPIVFFIAVAMLYVKVLTGRESVGFLCD